MKTKHIIITRLAIKWRFSDTKMSWNEWLEDSIRLMDKFCRPSLKNQKNQDFTLLSLVDETVNYYGNLLENEVVLNVIPSINNEYPRDGIITAINKYVGGLDDYDSIILSRIDRDDAFKYDFIDKVQSYLIKNPESYIDLNHSLTYDAHTNVSHDSKKYFNTFVSPFVSVHEKIVEGKIKCIPFLVDHNFVPNHLSGKKVNDLFAMQVIHGNNLKNKIYGNPINIDYKQYGFPK